MTVPHLKSYPQDSGGERAESTSMPCRTQHSSPAPTHSLADFHHLGSGYGKLEKHTIPKF